LGFLLIGVGTIYAQEQDFNNALSALNLSEQDETRIDRIQQSYLEAIKLPQAELAVIRASLTREMVRSSPSIAEIERILRSGIDYEVQLRMAEIRRELAMRELLGDQRWTRFKQLARLIQERGGDQEQLLQRLQRTRPELARILRIIQQYTK